MEGSGHWRVLGQASRLTLLAVQRVRTWNVPLRPGQSGLQEALSSSGGPLIGKPQRSRAVSSGSSRDQSALAALGVSLVSGTTAEPMCILGRSEPKIVRSPVDNKQCGTPVALA